MWPLTTTFLYFPSLFPFVLQLNIISWPVFQFTYPFLAMLKLMLKVLWVSYCQFSHSIYFFLAGGLFLFISEIIHLVFSFLSILRVIFKVYVWYFWYLYFCGSISILCFFSFLVVLSSSMPGIFYSFICFGLYIWKLQRSEAAGGSIFLWRISTYHLRLWAYPFFQLEIKQIQS